MIPGLVVVKNNQIVKGKWPLLDIEIGTEHSQQKGELTKDFKSVIDELYNGEPIKELACSYIVDNIDEPVKFNWIFTYDEPKIDIKAENENNTDDNLKNNTNNKDSSTPSSIEIKAAKHNLAKE